MLYIKYTLNKLYQYEYHCIQCFTACPPPVFEEFIDSSVSGGVAQNEIITLVQCQVQCAANSGCLAVDWDPGSSIQCWFHLNIVGFRRDTFGVVHYALVDRCPGGMLY